MGQVSCGRHQFLKVLYLIPINVAVTTTNGLDQDRFLDIAQIRSIDEQRVLGLVGVLEDFYWPLIQNALLIVCGFDLE
jgi:mRNA interferase MazF